MPDAVNKTGTEKLVAVRRIIGSLKEQVKDDPEILKASGIKGALKELRALDLSGWKQLREELQGIGLANDLLQEAMPQRLERKEASFEEEVEAASDVALEQRLTDYGNAERLVNRHGKDTRYCHKWGSWLIWNGKSFSPDGSGEIIRRGKDTVRSLYAEASTLPDKYARRNLAEWARKSEANERISAMIQLAKSEPGIPVSIEELDANPMQLPCLNGTLNLETGDLESHRRENFNTMVCPVVYDPSAKAPTFRKFLRGVFQEREELISYIQRVVGFALTGKPADRVMFFLYGRGRNGKSTLVELLHSLLGPYAKKTTADTLLAKPQGDGIPNDLAALKGARLVTSAELTEGRRLNEARIKDLTGRDAITARFFRQEFFTFSPEFKLFMYGNHKPAIRGTDEGIWDRVKLIPFEVRISDEEMDEHLPDRLRSELPGILNWALEGCLAWQQDGLRHPGIVNTATQEYRQEEDVLRDFFEECCIVQSRAQVRNPDLWSAYLEWCERTKERFPLGRKAFSQRLMDRGFTQVQATAKVWRGIGLVETQRGEGPTVTSSLTDTKKGVRALPATHEAETPKTGSASDEVTVPPVADPTWDGPD